MTSISLPMLSEQDWSLIRAHVREDAYARGRIILEEGTYRRALFIVRSGAVQVEQAHQGRGIAVAILGPGEIFGEMGFVENQPASASVVAQDDAIVEVIEGEVLQSVMASVPGLAIRFYHSLAIILIRRLRATSRHLAEAGTKGLTQQLRAPRTGNISARQVPAGLSAGLERFEREMLAVKQELRAGSVAEAEATARVAKTCDRVIDLMAEFLDDDPLVEMGWNDLLSFRDISHLEAGIGDYVFRETFHTLMLSTSIARCYAKPRGFVDDYETVAIIYQNEAEGDDRLGPLIDRWFLDRPICRSRRATRDALQSHLLTLADSWPKAEVIRVASLASGTAAECYAFAKARGEAIRISCIDTDNDALAAIARKAQSLGLSDTIACVRGNAIPAADDRISLLSQHFIYASGLCEYLNDDQIVALLDRAYDGLIVGGEVLVTNLGPSNPDRNLMEHVLDWKAIHRAEDAIRNLFARSKFGARPVTISDDSTAVTLVARCRKIEWQVSRAPTG